MPSDRPETTDGRPVVLVVGDFGHRQLIQAMIGREMLGVVLADDLAGARPPHSFAEIERELLVMAAEVKVKRAASAISGLPRSRKDRRAMAKGHR